MNKKEIIRKLQSILEILECRANSDNYVNPNCLERIQYESAKNTVKESISWINQHSTPAHRWIEEVRYIKTLGSFQTNKLLMDHIDEIITVLSKTQK